ncbi:MAG: radical SAM/SPASM domain-containing protein [Solidesulfovibrio sp. DCME]|uniref:radical SAM protein n=1 Tax=Solidesulfovibrio sp. DCME TaxID=3447380 RepID=UPI003D0C2EAF
MRNTCLGPPPPPTEVTFAVTSACNLRCRMCGQYGDAAGPPPPRVELSLNDVRRVVDEVTAATSGAGFFFWGGEPMLWPHLTAACRHARDRGAYVDINTNGTRLARLAAEVAEAEPDAIYLSLDGCDQASCDAIRGRGTFGKAMAGAAALLKARGAGARPRLHVVCTVLASNHALLAKMAPLARDMGVDGLVVQFPVYVTPAWGGQAEDAYERLFGVRLRSWRFFNHPHLRNELDTSVLVEQLTALEADSAGFELLVTPYGYPPRKLGDYFNDGAWRNHTRHARCSKIHFRVNIMPDGSVSPCGDFTEFVCGNIKQDALLSIWQGERYQRFREVIGCGILPNCYRCCELFDGRERDLAPAPVASQSPTK